MLHALLLKVIVATVAPGVTTRIVTRKQVGADLRPDGDQIVRGSVRRKIAQLNIFNGILRYTSRRPEATMLKDVDFAGARAIHALKRIVNEAVFFERIVLPYERFKKHLLREFAEHTFLFPIFVHRFQLVDETVRDVAQQVL